MAVQMRILTLTCIFLFKVVIQRVQLFFSFPVLMKKKKREECIVPSPKDNGVLLLCNTVSVDT